ncbi:hypothetical protein C7B76_10105 [filamentous cyanobacterium CCP2]|nr:hypothetical protein C7B76_10105 [filamentous cyanobacterium CCP2]
MEIEEIQSGREETLPNESLDEIGMPIVALILIYAGIVMTWLVFAFGSKSIWKFAKTSLTARTKLHPIPCRNCRYFAKNFYLQCAVRPSEVLTSQAIGCSDYCPKTKSLEK